MIHCAIVLTLTIDRGNMKARKRGHLIGLTLGITVVLTGHAQNKEIDKYIHDLQYDSRKLLSVREDGSKETLPARESGPHNVIICTNKKKGLTKSFDEVTILNPSAGVIYPGALVHADRRLAEGKPTAISLPRATSTISVDLPGLADDCARQIPNINYSSYQKTVNEILELWNKNPSSQGYVNAARSSLNIEKADSNSQLALSLGFSAKWVDNKISTNLAVDHSNKSASTVALFRQVFYTVTTDLPTFPSTVFAPEVTLTDIKDHGLNASSPPGYVKSVDYGRLIFVRMDTHSVKDRADLKGALNYVTGSDTTIDANLKARYQSVINNSTFTVLTIGGNAGVASRMFKPNQIDQLNKVIKENSVYSRQNPGYPISYTMSFLKDNEIATVQSQTDFVETNCVEYPNGYIKLKHSGAYVAKFRVDWQEKDTNGNPVSKSWESGNKTAGWTQTLNFPGDATGIRIQGWAATGLAWDPWGEIMNKVENGPTNQCYRAKGTTLGRSWDNDC